MEEEFKDLDLFSPLEHHHRTSAAARMAGNSESLNSHSNDP